MIKFEKQWFGGYHLTFFNKVNFYLGKKSLMNPGIGIDLSVWDRSLTINLIWFYFGVEIWYSE
jgi:hypothetical protein